MGRTAQTILGCAKAERGFVGSDGRRFSPQKSTANDRRAIACFFFPVTASKRRLRPASKRNTVFIVGSTHGNRTQSQTQTLNAQNVKGEISMSRDRGLDFNVKFRRFQSTRVNQEEPTETKRKKTQSWNNRLS